MMIPRVILVMTMGDFPRLEAVIATSVPDQAGMVTLYEPMQWHPDGDPTASVPVQYCFAFDPDLLRDANALTEGARDALTAVAKLIVTRVRPPFEPEEMSEWTTNALTLLMH